LYLRACAKQDVAVEINANPWRLDPDWRWHRQALEFGCLMRINVDAHSPSEIDHILLPSRQAAAQFRT
jgi:DNA polymerase (family X)